VFHCLQPVKKRGGARGGKAVHAMLFLDRRALVGGNFVGGTNFNFSVTQGRSSARPEELGIKKYFIPLNTRI
jgi:hypothetical protein